MRPPNAPPGLRYHLGPGLRGIAPAFIRAGVRFAISLDCCAKYSCQQEVAPHVTPRIHIKRPRGAKEHAAALRTLRPGPPVLGAPAVGGPGGSRRLSCIPDVPTGPRRALGSASWALPSPTPAVGGRNTGQTPPNPFYQSIPKSKIHSEWLLIQWFGKLETSAPDWLTACSTLKRRQPLANSRIMPGKLKRSVVSPNHLHPCFLGSSRCSIEGAIQACFLLWFQLDKNRCSGFVPVHKVTRPSM